MARFLRSWSTRTRRAERAGNRAKSTAGSTLSTSRRCSAPCAQIGSANAQGEYYLPDLVRVFRAQGLPVETVGLPDPREILGVNSRKELAEVSAILRDRKNDELMASGVTIVDPATTWVEPTCRSGQTRCFIRASIWRARPAIGVGLRDPLGRAHHRFDGRRSRRHQQLLRDSAIDDRGRRHRRSVRAAPPGVDTSRENAHVGNFVELKNTTLGRGSKANHLAYLGDATIGEKVNVGAGTITCNYDGVAKHPTVIEDGAFIGTDSQLIAPGPGRARAPTSPPDRRSPKTCPPTRWRSRRGKQVNKPGWAANARNARRD